MSPLNKNMFMISGKTIWGVLAGLAAGTILGAALAPKRSKAQKNITRKGSDLADALNAKIDEKLEELLGQVEDKINRRKEQKSSAEK